LRVTDIIWKDQCVEKLAARHGLTIREAEEALCLRPVVRKVARGRVRGEDLYAAMSQIHSGRYVIVFFIHKKHGVALPISARDMDASERRYYEKSR
jgi:uncharacterized DUF497 family protein